MKEKRSEKKLLLLGIGLVVLFAIWTFAIQVIDVQPLGQNGTNIGFEMFPVNYRPILIEGVMEASYPSSTTLLVLCVMPTLVFQTNRRLQNDAAKKVICIMTILFSAFMVIGRLFCGVHWFTDIVGGVLLSVGLFCIYKAVVLMNDKVEK